MGSEYSITIPAKVGNRPGVLPVNVRGKFLLVVSATGAFKFEADLRGIVPANTGTNWGTASKPFRVITFFNSTGSAIDVDFWVGDEQASAQQVVSVAASQTIFTKDAPTTPVASTAPAGATTTFGGTNAGRTRKQFAVFNAEPLGGSDITLKDNDGNGFTIIPREKISFNSSGVFKVTVPGGKEDAEIMETFYDA